MSKQFNKNRILAGLAVALLSTVLLILAQLSGALPRVEHIVDDWRMRWIRADSELDPRVAVVLIDDASLQALAPRLGRFPWSRDVYADLIRFLQFAGARAIVFDVLFAEPDGAEPDSARTGDRALVEASADSGVVYHAIQLMHDLDDAGRPLPVQPLPSDFVDRFGVAIQDDEWSRAYNRYLIPYDGLHGAAAGVGAVGLEPDDDGVYRRARLFWPYQASAYPLLGAAPILSGGGDALQYVNGRLKIGLRNIPVDPQARFAYSMVDRIPAYSIGGLLSSAWALRDGQGELVVAPEEFAGRIVFVGAGAAGLQDLKATALGARTPGVFIHASIASNLLQKEYLVPVSEYFAWALMVALAVATAAGVLWPRDTWLQLLAPVLLVGAYLAVAAAWYRWQVAFPVAGPIMAVALAWLFGAAFLAFTEGRDKRRVRTMLGQYVSPDVLNTVMSNYRDRVTAEVGSSEELSVLFSDIRGFTSLSESLSAEQVVDLLNIHFSEMTEIVFRHQGTLDKFIGDAMMVFWGAPVPAEDHADRALNAALDMYRGLTVVNQRLAEKGYPRIDIGIGLNTGQMVLGNVGSERKLDYTVVGDNVNLASRLEGLSKFYGCPIVISEFTLSRLRNPVPCVPLDLVRVKGKQVPIRVYAPLSTIAGGNGESANSNYLGEQLSTGFQAYLDRDWDRAQSIYANVPLARLRQIFMDRCIQFCGSPPSSDWDGVYTQMNK